MNWNLIRENELRKVDLFLFFPLFVIYNGQLLTASKYTCDIFVKNNKMLIRFFFREKISNIQNFVYFQGKLNKFDS